MSGENINKPVTHPDPSQMKEGYQILFKNVVDTEGKVVHPVRYKEYASEAEYEADLAKYPNLDHEYKEDEALFDEPTKSAVNAFVLPEDDSRYVFERIRSIDIKRIAVDVWRALEHEASFDAANRLILDGKETNSFVGQKGDGNYMATSERNDPLNGSAVAYVSETLSVNKTEAAKLICTQYGIRYSGSFVFQEPLKATSAEDLCNEEFSSVEWMIHRLIPENQITVVSGAPSSFKTMSAMEWAIQVASGGKAYGQFDTMRANVLLVNEDGDHRRVIKKRALFLTRTPPSNLFIMASLGFKAEESRIRELATLVRKNDIKFVILDSFRGIMPPEADEKDASSVRKIIDDLRVLTSIGATVLILHHDRKKPVQVRGYTSTDPNDLGEMMSGSADIRGAVDCHLAMGSARDKRENRHFIIVTQTKCREDELLPAFKILVNVTRDDSGNTAKMELLYEGEYKLDNKAETLEKARAAVLDFISKSADEYVARLAIVDSKIGGYGQRTLDEALKTLVADNSLKFNTGKELGKAKGEGRQKFYRIPSESELLVDESPIDSIFDPANF